MSFPTLITGGAALACRLKVTRVARAFALCLLLSGVTPPAYAGGESVDVDVPITGAFQATHREDVDNIAIIDFVGNYDRNLPAGVSNYEPRAVVAREFFRTHPDDYDFLVVFSTFEFDTGDALAFHWGIQNQVEGIGFPIFDGTADFGSDGTLLGYIDIGKGKRCPTRNVSLFPFAECEVVVTAY